MTMQVPIVMIIRTKTKGAVSEHTLSDNKVIQVPIVIIIRTKIKVQ